MKTKELETCFLELGPWSSKTFETWKDGIQNRKSRNIKHKTNQHLFIFLNKGKKQKRKQQSKWQKKTTKMNGLQEVKS